MLTIALTLSASLAGTACAGTSGDTTLSPGDQYLRTLLSEATPSEVDDILSVVLRAEESTAATCMRAEGFEYEAAPLESLYVTGNGMDLDDEQDVKRYGFGVSTRDLGAATDVDNPNDSTFAALDEGSRSLWAAAQAECAARARSSVDKRYGIDRAVRTAADVGRRIAADPRVVGATAEWSSCMKADGYAAADREELIADLQAEWAETEPPDAGAFRTKELAAAAATFDCGADVRRASAKARREALQNLDPEAHERLYGH